VNSLTIPRRIAANPVMAWLLAGANFILGWHFRLSAGIH
jgi:hypothetical protein